MNKIVQRKGVKYLVMTAQQPYSCNECAGEHSLALCMSLPGCESGNSVHSRIFVKVQPRK